MEHGPGQSPTADSIVSALAAGSFYGTTGIILKRIEVQGRTIHVSSENAERIVIVSDYGKREFHIDASELTFHVPDDKNYSYLRIECYGGPEQMAWTQPIFVKR